jgi:hypothetical protein
MVGATTVSTQVVVTPTSSDWVTIILVGCLWVSTIVTFDMIDEVVLVQR